MRAAARRMGRAPIEVMLFKVGEEVFGVELTHIEGVVQDLPPRSSDFDNSELVFKGNEIPLFGAQDVLAGTRPQADCTEALVLNDGSGLFGLAVDGTQGVVEITSGDDLYTFPPQPKGDASPCRAWGVWDTGSRMILLLDVSGAMVH